jgi:phage shock protein A
MTRKLADGIARLSETLAQVQADVDRLRGQIADCQDDIAEIRQQAEQKDQRAFWRVLFGGR